MGTTTTENKEYILLVDDDETILTRYQLMLEHEGYTDYILCSNPLEVEEILAAKAIQVVLLDLVMPHKDGFQILAFIKEHYPHIPVIIVTGEDSPDKVVKAMKLGALDYITKPISSSRFFTSLKNALEMRELHHEVATLSTRVQQRPEIPPEFTNIITRDPVMLSIFSYAKAIAPSPRPVLITGESGTGKELLARAIHAASTREGPLVTVNVAGLDDTLFSDTLFGHRKGAYTGAESDRPGLIERAKNGTLFLDEIGELSIPSQIKLLRLLQEGEYYPLGDDIPRKTNARVIAATCADLEAKQEEGTFRKDLYYRLMTHHIHLPPLRERRGDIPLLVEAFITQAARELGRTPPAVPPQLYDTLSSYPFPGNVRELQSLVFDAVSRSTEPLLAMQPILRYIRNRQKEPYTPTAPVHEITYETIVSCFGRFPTIEEMEKLLIREALKRTDGNQSAAAQILGISQSTLSRRLKKEPL
ncbi:sigma-54-dependent transcriptional regulator [Spirochaeta thermophila]|uniref:Transcriptional regulatory protein n=1 Tax=Winmispira thermophila (strain ATCC 49972 / DSM 6192 / RI 19.B1) TaxID=665571 RepID=E0RQV1_WINT6|nr:sigma-54 dependent transcriptional regulator [Spirochaeta thermophila]ADN03007.1 transcriptional regulatory protein [Spirochaeta thermophila DSM 6192]